MKDKQSKLALPLNSGLVRGLKGLPSMLLQWVIHWGACVGQGYSCSTSCATSKDTQCSCVFGQLLGCPPVSLMASSPLGQVSPRFLPLTLGDQSTTTSEALCY